jgi:DNA adenine methylase
MSAMIDAGQDSICDIERSRRSARAPIKITDAKKSWCTPIIRWAGSKRKLLPVLIRAVPRQYDRYFEPFVGSGCLFFALKPKQAVLGDINGELISMLRTLHHHPRLLHRQATTHKLNRRSYYRLRDNSEISDEITQRAGRFLALNRYCFNGLYRANSSGKFNVPFGSKTGTLPTESTFYRASVALRNARIIKGDFTRTLKSAHREDFVYLDPPYVYSGRRDRGEYGPNTFSVDDVERLFVEMQRLKTQGAFVLLSFIECDNVLKRAKGWNVQRVPVKRQISAFAQYRIYVNEVLISNYAFTLSGNAAAKRV